MLVRIASIQIGIPLVMGQSGAADPLDRPFRSAIWKEPTGGPVALDAGGFEGDAVANRRHHGGVDQAVLAYAASHYRRWRIEWDAEDLAYGAFGENLTVEDADEDVTCVGDVLDVAGVRLQVTQPREPCATLARRHGRPDLVKAVTTNGRSGWYLRVLRTGLVAAGTDLALVERPHPEWTIRRAAAVKLASASRLDEATELVGLPPLGRRFRASLRKRIDTATART